jgi:hypothetical protein
MDINEIGKHRISYEDFSGIYLQTSIKHAMNYIEHKANLSDTLFLALCKINVKTDYVIIDNPIFADGSIDSKHKSSLLKNMFSITEKSLLMDNLEFPIMIYDTVDDYELIVPHHLFNSKNIEIEIMKIYNIKEKKIGNVIYKYVS